MSARNLPVRTFFASNRNLPFSDDSMRLPAVRLTFHSPGSYLDTLFQNIFPAHWPRYYHASTALLQCRRSHSHQLFSAQPFTPSHYIKLGVSIIFRGCTTLFTLVCRMHARGEHGAHHKSEQEQECYVSLSLGMRFLSNNNDYVVKPWRASLSTRFAISC